MLLLLYSCYLEAIELTLKKKTKSSNELRGYHIHCICPVTKLAGNSLLQMLHSAIPEGSLASSLLSQAAPMNLHTYPGQHTDCYTVHLNDPWGCLSCGCTAFTSQSRISLGLHGKPEAGRSSAQAKLLQLFLPWRVWLHQVNFVTHKYSHWKSCVL